MRRWLKRPEGSNWGQFGDDDQIGRMNLITPARRLAAVASVTEGLAFPLSLPLDHPKKQVFAGRNPPVLSPTISADGRTMYDWMPAGGPIDVVNDDQVLLGLQYSTQWDGLSHYGTRFDADDDGEAEHVFYNGYRIDRDFVLPGEGRAPAALALGIEKLAETGVQGRGVLVDLRRSPEKVGYDALMRAMDAQGAEAGEGDFLCIHTGYADLLLRDGAEVSDAELAACPGLDGSDGALLDWIDRSGIAAICADNSMVEKIDGLNRCAGTAMMPLHAHCLVKLGVHLGEFWWFGALGTALAERGRSHFLLTAPPLNLPGAVGSPVTPIATI
ncbi:cyclase family protein [Novosphingobium sp. JCM 18896]|uniref:cyclase family protein n=1 Tax=Novosphingobium sp. JCM 18896 TaxID=2989731 RepID=UPI0022224868|nr:cyclase family protein [Novosphingobium sp. JCM 18896]MCW1428371.1 cyclase family protein [Novosphingobium sp. JCM 18896]